MFWFRSKRQKSVHNSGDRAESFTQFSIGAGSNSVQRPENDGAEQGFEAFKLEYEKAAERYENVYKAVWQNFYYMAFFAGGLFAFSPAALPITLRGGIGLIPLVFWFWATFLPLDHYGRQTRLRLGIIEEILNRWFVKEGSIDANDGLNESHSVENEEQAPRKALEHYKNFANTQERQGADEEPPDMTFPPGYRVRSAVCSLGFAVTTLCATLLIWYLSWFIGWHLGTSYLRDFSRFPEVTILLVIVVVAAVVGIVVLAKNVNSQVRGGIVHRPRMWLIIAINLIIYGFLWVGYLTDACAKDVQPEGQNFCWATEDNEPSVEVKVIE